MAPPMLSSSMFMWKVSRWILQLGLPLRIAHAGDFRRVDLKNIEATFLGSFDKPDGLRVPVSGPVSEVYSDGVHKLMQIGAGRHAPKMNTAPCQCFSSLDEFFQEW